MNTIHPSAVVGPLVELGSDNTIGPGVVLLGPLTVGDHNWFGAHTVIGAPAEIRGIDHGAAWDGQVVGAGLRIGSRNVLREYVTIHQGHHDRTVVGDDCYLMNKCYVGHDGHLADGVTMASAVALGGHVHVGAGANVGMNTVVHQRRVIGPGAMVGMASVVTHDIPPFATSYGSPCRLRGANSIGMQRAGFPAAAVEFVTSAYARGQVPVDGVPETLRSAWSWWQSEVGA